MRHHINKEVAVVQYRVNMVVRDYILLIWF